VSILVFSIKIKLSGMVNTDCALCADMGADILKLEGSAVDAAITTILCNGLVNMHSSGLGGYVDFPTASN